MGKRPRRTPPVCRRCKLQRLPEETFWGGLCPACRDVYAHRRRKATGALILEKAKAGGTEERDGQAFQVAVLPPKRRRGRRR
jgi:hypothetical protein